MQLVRARADERGHDEHRERDPLSHEQRKRVPVHVLITVVERHRDEGFRAADRMQRVRGGLVERREFLADLVRLHRLRREPLGGSDGLGDDRMVAFHDAFTARAQRAGWLRLYRLVLDGAVVAAVYGAAVGDKFYFYQSGFDPAFGRHSVGLLILAHSIRDAIGEGLAEYDLLHGNEGYKYQWAEHERPLMRHHLYPPRLHGAVAHRLFGLKQQLKTCRVA